MPDCEEEKIELRMDDAGSWAVTDDLGKTFNLDLDEGELAVEATPEEFYELMDGSELRRRFGPWPFLFFACCEVGKKATIAVLAEHWSDGLRLVRTGQIQSIRPVPRLG